MRPDTAYPSGVVSSCVCAAWSQPTVECNCDADGYNCKGTETKTCNGASEVFTPQDDYVGPDKNSCDGDPVRSTTCQNEFGPWSEWGACPSCVDLDLPVIVTRTKECTIDTPGCAAVTETKDCSPANSNTVECLKCKNFANYCSGEGMDKMECVDETNDNVTSATCQCIKPFGKDENGQCTKCNALRPFTWQCGGELLFSFLVRIIPKDSL